MRDINTIDYRLAYARAPLLRLAGYSFERAMATELVRRGLELSARARIRREEAARQPYQVPLI